MHHSHRTLQIFRFIFLFLFLLLSVETVRCQVLPFQSYTTRDGLPSNTIRAIYQDTRSYLWIGTNNGLSRYDGAKFTNYSTVDGLSNNWITSIAESAKEPGTLWIGTIAGGVNRLRDRRFTVFRSGPDNTSNNIQSVDVDSSGTVWLKAWDRMYYIRGDSLSEFAPPYGMEGVRYSLSFADDTPWLAAGSKLFRYERLTGRWRRIHTSASSRDTITGTAPCKTGGIWIGWSNGRISLVRDTSIILSFLTRHGEPHLILDDGKGQLWVHTRKMIFTVSTSEGRQLRIVPFVEDAGSPADVTPPMMLDHENNLWLGTWTQGLMKLSDRNLYHIPIGERGKTFPRSGAVADSNGHIWTGARGGILELYADSTGVWQQYLHTFIGTSPNAECYVSLLDRAGRLWITVDGNRNIQAYKISSQPWKQSQLTPGVRLTRGKHYPEGVLLMLFVDAQDRMFISVGQAGVAVVDLKRLTPLGMMTTGVGVPGLAVRVMLQDRQGIIWMGGWNDGISLFDPGTPLPSLLRKYAVEDGLPDNSIRSFHEDCEGTMWVGTRYGGIARLVGKRFETASMNDGLMSNTIWTIDEDEHDRLYLRTDVGIERIDRRTMKPVPQKLELLDQEIVSLGVLQRRFLWYTSSTELTVYEYPLASGNTVPPPAHIFSFQANGKMLDAGSPIALPFNENNCVIEYDGISYKNEKAVRYQYRLLGTASDWTAPTAQRAVTFATLKPGFYTFEVVAINADNVASTKPASLSFSILPPYWQRWWFIAIVALVLAAVGTLLYRYRVNQLLEVERLRVRIAGDLHDDVGTNLSSIVIASQIMERQASLSPKERSQLKEIGIIATTTQEMMRDIVWMLNPKNDSLDDFVLKMKEVTSQLLQDIRYTFVVPEERLLDKVSIEFKRNVFLIFKESLNNIVRHSFASEVSIAVKQENGTFTLQIEDNGKGFEGNRTFPGSGLANIRRRALQMGGAMDIHSAAGKGTTITLSVKNHANA